MAKIKNPNHPRKGQVITVEPIRSIEKIAEISALLSDKPRDLLLFTIGINNGLRVGDLLKLKVGDVKGMQAGDTLKLKESKTGKINIFVTNRRIAKQVYHTLEGKNLPDDEFLFKSRKGNGPLTIQAVNNYVKKWTAAVGLSSGNYGAHSLRKTWGYHQRKTYGVGFEIIARRFNHSNPAVTMRYLGIEDSEVHSVLLNEIG